MNIIGKPSKIGRGVMASVEKEFDTIAVALFAASTRNLTKEKILESTEDRELGIKQAKEMMDNMQKYGVINNPYATLEKIKQKFTSGNEIPVPGAYVTQSEFQFLLWMIEDKETQSIGG